MTGSQLFSTSTDLKAASTLEVAPVARQPPTVSCVLVNDAYVGYSTIALEPSRGNVRPKFGTLCQIIDGIDEVDHE
jgi:hypothetical protein